MAEFEELGVCVFEELYCGFGSHSRVVEECRVPANDSEVFDAVGNSRLQDLLPLAFGQFGQISAHDLGDLFSTMLH